MVKRKNKTRKILPPLKKTDMKNKKYKYRLDGTDRMRRMAMNEGVRAEAKRLRKTLKEAAINKKGRLNILRIYRRNKNLNHCRTITKDMKYLDKKYKLGKIKKIKTDFLNIEMGMVNYKEKSELMELRVKNIHQNNTIKKQNEIISQIKTLCYNI